MERLTQVDHWTDITSIADQERVIVCYDADRKELGRGTRQALEAKGLRWPVDQVEQVA